MKHVRLTMSEAHYEKLLAQAKEQGLTLNTYLSKRLGVSTTQADLEEVAAHLIGLAKERVSTEEFKVSDLIGQPWSTISVGDRVMLGKLFHDRVCAAEVGIQYVSKSCSGHSLYKRVA